MKRNLAAPLLFVALGVGFCAAAISQTPASTPLSNAATAKADPLAGDARLSRRIDYRCQKAKLSDILVELLFAYPKTTIAKIIAKNCKKEGIPAKPGEINRRRNK